MADGAGLEIIDGIDSSSSSKVKSDCSNAQVSAVAGAKPSKFLTKLLNTQRTTTAMAKPEPECALNDEFLTKFRDDYKKMNPVAGDTDTQSVASSECGVVTPPRPFRQLQAPEVRRTLHVKGLRTFADTAPEKKRLATFINDIFGAIPVVEKLRFLKSQQIPSDVYGALITFVTLEAATAAMTPIVQPLRQLCKVDTIKVSVKTASKSADKKKFRYYHEFEEAKAAIVTKEELSMVKDDSNEKDLSGTAAGGSASKKSKKAKKNGKRKGTAANTSDEQGPSKKPKPSDTRA